MRIAIYGRKSVFTGRGDSVENQIALCRRYIQERIAGGAGADLFIYEDEGFSGKDMRRPQFKRMMEAARAEPFDYIICYRLDRISRSVSDFAPFVEELIGRGIAFVCIKEQFDTSTPMGKAMMYIASVFAQLERETIAERVRDNMYQLARSGRWLGGTPPLGFCGERVTAAESGRKRTVSRLVSVPEEQTLVREIFRLFLERQSLSALEKALGQRAVTRQGGAFTAQSLRELLQNPVYCAADTDAYAYFAAQGAQLAFSKGDCQPERGLLAYGKREYGAGHAPRRPVDCWILAVGQHKSLLPGRDWVRVQALLAQNRSLAEAKPHNLYALYSGLLRCGLCGGRMFAKRRQNSPDRFDYICERKLRGGKACCPCQNLAGPETDETLTAELLRRCIPPDAPPPRHEPNPSALAALEQELAATALALESLTSVLERPYLDDALLTQVNLRACTLSERREVLLCEREQLVASHPAPGWADCFSRLPLREQRTLLRTLLTKAVWDGVDCELFLRENLP